MKSWHDVHAAIGGLAQDKAAYAAQEAYWIREGERIKVWTMAGYGSYAQYLEAMLGYGARSARERIRTARELADLPAMTQALVDGEIHWTTARELTRVATDETESIWLEAAEGERVRAVEQMVSGLSKGDLPGTVREPGAEHHVARFEVSAATLAQLREARMTLTKEMGHSLTDDELVLSLARAVLGGAGTDRDPGRSSYQLAITRCPDCERTLANGDGQQVVLDEATVSMIECDVQRIPMNPGRANTDTNANANANAEMSHVGHSAITTQSATQSATQSVTPAKRRAVIAKHHHRCAVPGCTHAAYLDVHHDQRQADGGNHDIAGLVPLCGAHHHAHHAGRINVELDPTSGRVTVTHADGTKYGRPRSLNPQLAETHAHALSALVNLGFKDRQARKALQAAPNSPDLTTLIRSALIQLR